MDKIEEYEVGCELECKGGIKDKFKNFKEKILNVRLPKYELERKDLEFIGDVKVVLVTTPRREYWENTVGSAFVVLAFFTLGATNIHIFFYSLCTVLDKMTSLHIILFTAGFQLLIPVSFLTTNTYNGASNFLKPNHRICDYIIIKLISLACVIAGLIVLNTSESLKLMESVWSFSSFSWHAVTGSTAVALCLLDFLALLYMILFSNSSKGGVCPRFALALGLPSFAISSVCFILALVKHGFMKWLPLPAMAYFFIFFCIFNTIFTLTTSLRSLRCYAVERQ